jgi:hypothetical protein
MKAAESSRQAWLFKLWESVVIPRVSNHTTPKIPAIEYLIVLIPSIFSSLVRLATTNRFTLLHLPTNLLTD